MIPALLFETHKQLFIYFHSCSCSVLAFRGISISRFPPWARRVVWRPPEAQVLALYSLIWVFFEKVIAL